jgi:hypothetical protein
MEKEANLSEKSNGRGNVVDKTAFDESRTPVFIGNYAHLYRLRFLRAGWAWHTLSSSDGYLDFATQPKSVLSWKVCEFSGLLPCFLSYRIPVTRSPVT